MRYVQGTQEEGAVEEGSQRTGHWPDSWWWLLGSKGTGLEKKEKQLVDSGVKQEAAAEPGDVIGAQGLECHAKEYEFDLVDSGNTLVLQMKGKTWAVRPRRRMC